MESTTTKKATGYDKYVDWKIFSIPVVLLFVILYMPTPYGMKDVGVEYKVAPKAVVNFFTQSLFDKPTADTEQWELLAARIMHENMLMGSLGKGAFEKRDFKWTQSQKFPGRSTKFRPGHGVHQGKGQRREVRGDHAARPGAAPGRSEIRGSCRERPQGGRHGGLAHQGRHGHGGVRGALFSDRMHPAAGRFLLRGPAAGLHRRGLEKRCSHALLGRRRLVYHGQPHVCRGPG